MELRFATFRETAVNVVPALVHEPIAPDLSNVRLAYLLSSEQRERLAQDGLVVAPGTAKEFFTVYEQARYANAPLFVTSDSVLHVYHLLFNETLRTAERDYFIPLLRDLNEAMLAQTDAQYQTLRGAEWEDAAQLRAAGFDVVGLANNHSLDLGSPGLEHTAAVETDYRRCQETVSFSHATAINNRVNTR